MSLQMLCSETMGSGISCADQTNYRDPAMLNYLDGDRNRKGAPNETRPRIDGAFVLGEGLMTRNRQRSRPSAHRAWIH